MSGLNWIKHNGGPMPVPWDAMVRIKANDGYESENSAESYADTGWWDGSFDAPTKDQIAEYAIVAPAPTDAVNHPAHYTSGDIECIDAIKAQMSADEFAGYLRGNVVKYIWRYRDKGGVESLEKARWYLERLIGELRA